MLKRGEQPNDEVNLVQNGKPTSSSTPDGSKPITTDSVVVVVVQDSKPPKIESTEKNAGKPTAAGLAAPDNNNLTDDSASHSKTTSTSDVKSKVRSVHDDQPKASLVQNDNRSSSIVNGEQQTGNGNNNVEKEDDSTKSYKAEGKHLLTWAIPRTAGVNLELLKLEFDCKIGPNSFTTNGLSEIYYNDYVVDLERIRFFLFTSESHQRAEILQFSNPHTLYGSNWNPKNPTKIYIHGYAQSGKRMMADIKNAYFDGNTDAENQPNLIICDWGKYSHALEYFYTAKYIVPLVGIAVGKLIQMLLNCQLEEDDYNCFNGINNDHAADEEDNGERNAAATVVTHDDDDVKETGNRKKDKSTKPELIHIIGHSLGAHIASKASRYIDVQLARITGLDPAGPFFQGLFALPHITKNDAMFVDIIHSNMNIFGFGMYDKVGHVDFYPNGGAWQEGCPFFANLDNHERSVYYYIESINADKPSAKFYGQKAESWIKYKRGILQSTNLVEMGDHLKSDVSLEGNYYLKTNGRPPYAKGKIGINVKRVIHESA